jgi:hypothetical protein
MKHLLLRTVAGTGLILFGVTASMQAQRPRDDDSYHRDRDDYYRGDQWRARMFEKVRDDLNHVQTTWFGGATGDEYRIAKAKQELNELQNAIADHRYDQRALDDVIGAIQRVVSDNRLSGRDRDILNDDLNRLREFRERHNDWGAR